jgi:nucleoside-diphosphate-sugar epimerase
MSPVLVTGGSGYVATQLMAALLRDGRPVRATVRSTAGEPDLRAAVRRGDAAAADRPRPRGHAAGAARRA